MADKTSFNGSSTTSDDPDQQSNHCVQCVLCINGKCAFVAYMCDTSGCDSVFRSLLSEVTLNEVAEVLFLRASG